MDKWTLPMCVFLSLLLLWSSWSLTLCSAYLMMSRECSGRTLRLGRGPPISLQALTSLWERCCSLVLAAVVCALPQGSPTPPAPPTISPSAHWLGHIALAQLTVDTLTIYTHNRAPVAGALWEAWRAECLMMGNWQS